MSAIETIAIDGGFASRTGDVETLLVVLSGTFDMVAGGGTWPARGVRKSPCEGKPVSLFLPPGTGFELQNGSGEILLVSGVSNTAALPVMTLVLMETPGVGRRHIGAAAGIFFTVAQVGGFTGPLFLGLLRDLTGTLTSGLVIHVS